MGFFSDILSPVGDFIGGVGSAVSGILGVGAADDATDAQKDMAEDNIKYQKEFAQKGIRWKVADAKKAGVHPLYALGANTVSFTPQYLDFKPNTALADMSKKLGQDLGRVITSVQNIKERKINVGIAEEKLKQSKIKTEADQMLLNSEKKRLQVGAGPPMADVEPYKMGGVETVPVQRPASPKGSPHQEVGDLPGTSFVKFAGGVMPVPGSAMKQNIEDMAVPEILTAWELYGKPSLYGGMANKPSKGLLKKYYPGAIGWEWDAPYYKPVYPGKKRKKGIFEKFKKYKGALDPVADRIDRAFKKSPNYKMNHWDYLD